MGESIARSARANCKAGDRQRHPTLLQLFSGSATHLSMLQLHVLRGRRVLQIPGGRQRGQWLRLREVEPSARRLWSLTVPLPLAVVGLGRREGELPRARVGQALQLLQAMAVRGTIMTVAVGEARAQRWRREPCGDTAVAPRVAPAPW